jgi:hypothetical protein
MKQVGDPSNMIVHRNKPKVTDKENEILEYYESLGKE